MSSVDSHKCDSPQTAASTPIAELSDVAEGRRELARLIGRLLAHEWLARQRTGKQGRDSENTPDKKALQAD